MSAHFVYRLYDGHGDVLYVGCTSSLPGRVRSHSTSKTWWSDVRAMDWDCIEDKDAALAHERRQIALLNPPHNTRYANHTAA